MADGEVLWRPTERSVEEANVTKFQAWVEERRGKRFADYAALWRWSTEEIEEFWGSVWEYFEVWSASPYSEALRERTMPGARWFEGSRLNYAEHVFRNRRDDEAALLVSKEGAEDAAVTWGELKAETASLAAFLREEGVGAGDRVAGLLPNCPEAVVGLLAAASIGAIWTCCPPETGPRSVIDRLEQVAPKAFIGVEGYEYGGKWFDRRGAVEQVRGSVSSIRTTVVTGAPEREGAPMAEEWVELGQRTERLRFEAVPFDHPLWILYTSGTTGPPKPVVHGHGGILLEHLKSLSLHNDVRRGDRVFWYTSAGWMMWNYLLGALLLGASVVLFDGDPLYPGPGNLWEIAGRTGATFFGAGASYFDALAKSGFRPESEQAESLRGVGSTGSPLYPATFEWIHETVRGDLWIASISGGTDLCTAFVGGNPTLPVRSGRIQCRCLGAAVAALDPSGKPLLSQVGELALTAPMPSMPLYLWGDVDGSRYRESYFDSFPGVWRHGDWARIDPDGTCVILGRSDATIKRRGVRAGTSEVYGVVESVEGVRDSLVVDLEYPGGESFMPLFVALMPGRALDGRMREEILARVRTDLSPRLVPDEVVLVDEVPRTLNGKKTEVPVKRVLMGAPADQAVSPGSLRNPDSMKFFEAYRDRRMTSR